MCSCCGKINDELTLKDREWTCEYCGVPHDRDFNASVNIEQETLRIVAASLTETLNACEVRKRWLGS
jgi:putative transposase